MSGHIKSFVDLLLFRSISVVSNCCHVSRGKNGGAERKGAPVLRITLLAKSPSGLFCNNVLIPFPFPFFVDEYLEQSFWGI